MKIVQKLGTCSLLLALVFLGGTASAAGLGNNIAVRLVGTDVGYDGVGLFTQFGLTAPGGGALCFDVDLVDVKTGKIIGTASDCLSNIGGVGDGLALTGTTFFFFPGGTVVSQGLTTVQPTTHGSADFTHITGAIPQPGDNNVIYGDRKFKNASGPVRLSGTVNLAGSEPNEFTFDCIFILDIGGS